MNKNSIVSVVEDLERLTEALEKIRNNPDGGVVRVESEDGAVITFTMPPLSERKTSKQKEEKV